MNAVTDTLVSRLVAICGAAGVISERDGMTPYETEWRQRWHGKARLVVRPATAEEVSAVVKLCAAEGIAVVPQGGNTGLCEGAMPDHSGQQIVISLARMNRIRHLDPLDFTMTVEAGCVLQTLQEKAREAGCFFPAQPGRAGQLHDRRQHLDQCRRRRRVALWQHARFGAGPGSRSLPTARSGMG